MKKVLILVLISLFLNTQGYSQCDSITTFPWFEGFENNQNTLPDCWSQDKTHGGWDFQPWSVVSNNHFSGIPPTSHSGEYKVIISLDCNHDSQHMQDLASPPFDISGLENPTLTFWYSNDSRGRLTLSYKSSKDQENWYPLHGYFAFPALNWTMVSLSLPNKSNYYQIAFIGYHIGGGFGFVQLDDISISDGPLSINSDHTEQYHTFPNPVQDYLNISGNNISKTILYDIFGRIIYSESGEIKTINMTNNPKGIYLLQILTTDGNIFSQKIIKQ